ncbi:hypothetical protein C2S53_017552 [Perilla frutescens var. hirtella]|uniref:Uncharacterized protein n=1 Tax=Perilla frutescens var. hirtella TaxID=608512 RepID=A0AAD4P4G4_PERFH|nr:hypothetical protein C2S53_017552 [Perilla frutescens var. hirtella]
MQTSSIICCSSNSFTPSLNYLNSHPFTLIPKNQTNSSPKFSFSSKLPISLHIRPLSHVISHSTAAIDLVKTTPSASAFVETGYIYGVHGFRGEVRVKPSTDFPDLRFSKPGTRWLKQQVSGSETIREIELVDGRGNPGLSWIVKFENIDSMEEAQKLVGSVILVRDDDRPPLEEGEFYTHDLIGMRVILKESGEPVGTVVNVFNSGASDLLHVKLNSSRKIPDQIGNSKTGEGDSGPLAWVPFVEAIVPTVDMGKREMLITPPKGLLELNVRSDTRSKKERREIEWKERKKFQRRLIAAKKKLSEMEQQHVFHGFRDGEKDQRSLLANQIVNVNSKLLHQALQNIEILSTRPDLLQILSAVPRSNRVKVSDKPSSSGTGLLSDPYCKLQRSGYVLTSNGKVAIVLVLEEIEAIDKTSYTSLVNSEGNESANLLIKALVDDHSGFVKIEDRSTVPLLLVASTGSINPLQEGFSDHDYFGFDPEKVWFLEEEKLPLVSSSIEEGRKHKILMKSPWEFLQRPIGSGGVISLLSSQESLLDELGELGVEYIQVCKINPEHKNDHALVGLVNSCKSNVGLRLFKGITTEESFDVIFSTSFLRKLVKQINKLQFEAVHGCSSYVEKVEKDWVDAIPTAPNSYEFRSSIYCCLVATPPNKICVLSPTDLIHG